MHKSPTPEHFINRFLNPAARRGSLPSVLRIKPSGKSVEIPPGKITQIIFRGKRDPRRKCFFSIEQTKRHTTKRRTATYSLPHFELFSGIKVPFSDEEWDESAEKTGIDIVKHPGERGSATARLLIPEEAIAHWKPEKDQHNPQRAFVDIEDELLDKLTETQHFYTALEGYMHALRHWGKQADQEEFARAISTNTKLRQQLFDENRSLRTDQDPKNVFLGLMHTHHDLFKALAIAPIGKIPSILTTHFGKNYQGAANKYAKKIQGILSNNWAQRAANEIATAIEEREAQRKKPTQ